MRRFITIAGVTSLLCASTQAVTFNLFESALNIDGTTTPNPVPGPGSVFDTSTGLGFVRVTVTGAGSHYVGFFVDHDIDAPINTFFNEVGSVGLGAPPAGLSWEIDEPGYSFGDIYTHFTGSALENANGLPGAEDVSMALAFAFVLGVDETATLNFIVDTQKPAGFSLQQTDPDSDASLYYSAALRIAGGGGPGVPDGGSTMALLLGAGVVLAGYRVRSRES